MNRFTSYWLVMPSAANNAAFLGQTPPTLLETFVEYERQKRICYTAANWINVSRTTGRGKEFTGHTVLVPAKDIWPLCTLADVIANGKRVRPGHNPVKQMG